MTYILVLKKTLHLETIVIKLNSHLKNTMKFFRTIFTSQKFNEILENPVRQKWKFDD